MQQVIISFLLLLSFNALAVDFKQVVKISNDTDNLVAFINILTDENNEISGYEYSKYRDDVLVNIKTFPATIDYSGFVLERAQNRDVVILRGINVSEINGGTLEVDFLFNAISGARGHFKVDLNRTSNSWQLTRDGVIVKHLHLVANNRPGIGVIGIRQILVQE